MVITDVAGKAVTNTFTYGPKLKPLHFPQLVNGKYVFNFTNVTYLGTNNLGGVFVQPDQYQFDVVRDDQTTVANVLWTGMQQAN